MLSRSYLVLRAIRAANTSATRWQRIRCASRSADSGEMQEPSLVSPYQTVPAPQAKDKPYIDFDEEAREWFSHAVIDVRVQAGEPLVPRPEVDIDSEPFRQIYEGNDDHGNFTQVEVVEEPGRWYWVERLIKKKESLIAPHITSEPDVKYPSGWTAPPDAQSYPKRSYFVPRTRNKLFPVYKVVLPDEHESHAPFKFRPRQQPMVMKIPYKRQDPLSFKTLTVVQHIDGEIRDFERDLRSWLEAKHKKKILSACEEGNGKLVLKGEYTEDVVYWLKEQGF